MKDTNEARPAALLTSADVCNMLHIDRSTLSRWVASGRIVPEQKLNGKRGTFLFTYDQVRAARESRTRRVES